MKKIIFYLFCFICFQSSFSQQLSELLVKDSVTKTTISHWQRENYLLISKVYGMTGKVGKITALTDSIVTFFYTPVCKEKFSILKKWKIDEEGDTLIYFELSTNWKTSHKEMLMLIEECYNYRNNSYYYEVTDKLNAGDLARMKGRIFSKKILTYDGQTISDYTISLILEQEDKWFLRSEKFISRKECEEILLNFEED